MDIPLARAWIRTVAAAMEEHQEQLTQLDSAIGDADHGVNMHRGFSTVIAALDGLESTNVGDVLVKTGTILISSVGGASGPLYGTFFRAAGRQLTTPTTDAEHLLAALEAGLAGLQKLGGAVPGDKTMVDAIAPALAAFAAEVRTGGSVDLTAAAVEAAAAARRGMLATIPLQARKGRASYLGARSIGHQDPGATSAALVFQALADVLQAE
ncbi:dihydroxyacetone kinase subunit DhaL [Catenulispora subtropica]